MTRPTQAGMTNRTRYLILAVIGILAAAAAVGFYLVQRGSVTKQLSQPATVTVTDDLAGLLAQDHVVFRSAALDETYGKLAVAALAAPDGPRAIRNTKCDRVYATAAAAMCLRESQDLLSTGGFHLLNAGLEETANQPLTGVPSRARMTADGAITATTVFVTGHSYAEMGTFSTETLIRTGGTAINLETFTATVDGKPFAPPEVNYWGVTFVDDDTFYATASLADKTWLMRGSISARTLVSLRGDAECPSVSPDRTKVAYKVRGENFSAANWRIAVLDLATGEQHLTAENRIIDDQVEWLDNSTLLYEMPRTDGAGTSDIWQVAANGSGTPTIFIRKANSPAVVRR
jgi:hypothetical protein